MIRIAVISHQGAPAPRKLAAQFGADGGTIGRAPTNALVLDDPDRTVSRVHAQVLCRDGRFFIVDRGSNPMLCNGHPLGAGHEAALSQGDRLVIGGFELVVEMLSSQHAPAAAAPSPAHAHAPAQAALPTDDDPFADLLAGLGPAAPAAAPAAMQAPAPAGPFPDPLGAGRAPAASADDPFADLLAPSAPASGGAAAPARGLPLDDFSDLGLSSVPQGLGDRRALRHRRCAAAAIRWPARRSATRCASPTPPRRPIRWPRCRARRRRRRSRAATIFRSASSRTRRRARWRLHLPVTPRFDDMTGEAIRAAPAAPVPQAAPAAVTPAATPVAQAAPPAATPAAPPDALLAAFLRGLGSTHQAPQQLTPELMERIGVLLRSATEGTLQLLLTRQEFKRELRAEVTMIAAQANNPLKFSPTAEVALAHLLGPGMRGFMPAEAAMRDAFDDLRAHQFGVMVGMRAALAQVIERFAPAELEKKIAAKSALDSLFAANRKAKLWDQFIALYGGIASEAEDDFHALFGKAFLEAYEAQMARLKSGGS